MLWVYLKSAFTLWMLIDAGRRRADFYWYMVILMPFGELVYFFAVKIHDFDLRGLKRSFRRPTPVAELRRRAEETPSVENRLALAGALFAAKEFHQAQEVYAGVLQRDRRDKEALHGLAHSKLELGELDAAIGCLEALHELDPAYADYEAWLERAYTHWRLGQHARAVGILQELVTTSPRIKHKAILGRYLIEQGEREAARATLNEAVADYQQSPSFVRRQNQQWVDEARGLLRKVG